MQLALNLDNSYWYEVKDGNADARQLFNNHYSRYFYKDGRKPKLFVGPGEKIVLLGKFFNALFVWRKFISGDNQKGINCAIFRNESDILSSKLIIDAENYATRRWPPQRLYTYVNQKKIKSINPGFCFKKAGWHKYGITKTNKLLILEKTPHLASPPRGEEGSRK